MPDLREKVARWLARYYWKVRSNDITDEMEDEFWLSFVKEADRILALVEADARERERKAFVAGAKYYCDEFAGEYDWHSQPYKAEAARRYKP
jgi:hypothetical protein